MIQTTNNGIGAMSAEELDTAIAQLRRRQESLSRAVFGDGDNYAPDFRNGDWETDAANLRGDMERVGIDMWIGLLRAERARKAAG